VGGDRSKTRQMVKGRSTVIKNGSRHVLRLVHKQILEILVDTVDTVDVIVTHRYFIDVKDVRDLVDTVDIS
jgi:hypothetical protein